MTLTLDANDAAGLEWMTTKRDPFCNVGESIAAKIGVNLHQQKHHPLNIIKTTIEGYFDKLHSQHGCVRPPPSPATGWTRDLTQWSADTPSSSCSTT
jgi:hypothetical protein